MQLKDYIYAQIDHKETTPVPYTLNFDRGTRDLLDEHYGSPSWREKIVPYISKVWAVDNLYKRYLDNGYSKDIYGSLWREDGKAAHLTEPALPEPRFDNFTYPPVDAFLKRNEFAKAEQECRNHSESFRIVHIPWGLFERSWALRGFESALMDMVIEESFYEDLLEKILTHLEELTKVALQLPIDGIMYGDDWGGQQGLLMGAERWRKFFKSRYSRLYSHAKQAGKKVFTHCCGNIVEIIPDLIEIGLDVYESFQPEVMDIYAVKAKYGKEITFWGGLGAQSIIPQGTPEDIAAEVARMKKHMARGGGFILAPAKEPPEETPVKNLVALIESITGS